jgi:hypothetical protein
VEAQLVGLVERMGMMASLGQTRLHMAQPTQA